jgi:hypothetical protein
MEIALLSTPYCDFQVCTLVDGFQSLGHTVYNIEGTSLNYMEPWPITFQPAIDLFVMADTNNGAGMSLPTNALGFGKGKKIPKVIVHGHDLWTDYVQVPNSPKKPVPYDKAVCDIMFVRDLDQSTIADTTYPVYPMEFGIERRYQEASMVTPFAQREYDVAFFGTPNTARRKGVMDALSRRFKCSFGDHVTFKDPDRYWSKWVNGRYVHAPKYYEALCNARFALSPLGAGPTCGRTYEAYASGCIPLIQRYPDEIKQIVPFVDGENCLLWSTKDELISKVEIYLKDESKLASLLEAAYDFGVNNLTSAHRAQYILDKCKDHFLLL